MDAYAVVARLLLAAVFAVSGIAKLRDREGTRRAVEGFGLPERVVEPVTAGLPFAECAVSILLIPGTTARAGAIAAIALLAAFIVGISVSLAQGRRPDCHCFGQLHSAPVGPSTLVRNVILAAAAGVVAFGAGSDAGGSLPDAAGDLDATGFALVIAAVAAVVLALVLLARRSKALITGTPGADEPSPSPPGPTVGSVAPEFSLAASSGATVTLRDLRARGNDVLIVFFSPSCGPCKRIAPELARWQRDFPGRLTVSVISSGSRDTVRESASEYDIAEMLADEHGTVAKSYGSRGTPGAVLIRASGEVASPYAAGEAPIRDLLIEAFGLTEVVAAVAVEKEAAEPVHDRDDSGDHEGHGREAPASAAADLFDPEAIDRGFLPVGRDDVAITEREGETVLVDRATGAVHLLNPTAAIVWQCLDGSGSVDEIVSDIAHVFEREIAEVREAVLEVVRMFGRQGLLEGVGTPKPDQSPSGTTTLQETSRNAD